MNAGEDSKVKIEFESIVSADAWQKHRTNWRTVLDLLKGESVVGERN